jgi:hypothetical protein
LEVLRRCKAVNLLTVLQIPDNIKPSTQLSVV